MILYSRAIPLSTRRSCNAHGSFYNFRCRRWLIPAQAPPWGLSCSGADDTSRLKFQSFHTAYQPLSRIVRPRPPPHFSSFFSSDLLHLIRWRCWLPLDWLRSFYAFHFFTVNLSIRHYRCDFANRLPGTLIVPLSRRIEAILNFNARSWGQCRQHRCERHATPTMAGMLLVLSSCAERSRKVRAISSSLFILYFFIIEVWCAQIPRFSRVRG